MDGENIETDDYETEIIDGSLTFDELLEDEAYKAEFEKRVQQRLDIQKNSHPDVKGGTNTMDGQEVQKPNEGEQINGAAQAVQEPQTPRSRRRNHEHGRARQRGSGARAGARDDR